MIKPLLCYSNLNWIVGDIGKDIQTGKILGMNTVAVPTGFLYEKILRTFKPEIIVDKVTLFKSFTYLNYKVLMIRNQKLTVRMRINKIMLRLLYGGKVNFGKNLRILGNFPILKIPKNGIIEFGENVVLNSDFKNSNTSLTTKVKFVTGINGKIIIGNNCDFNGTCFVAYDKIIVGDYCQFASSTLISDTDFHPVDPEIRLQQMKGFKINYESVNKKQITIGNNVWVGWGSIILKGVSIGDNSVIAAGSIVVSDVPPNCIVAGNPAKVVKKLS